MKKGKEIKRKGQKKTRGKRERERGRDGKQNCKMLSFFSVHPYINRETVPNVSTIKSSKNSVAPQVLCVRFLHRD